jgi:Ca-activated chloride channel family protein
MSERKQAGGLFAGEQRIPLRGVKIDVKATGAAAQVTVSQRYQNTEKVPVEAVYSFPLEESCAVCRFEVEIGGKRIVGKIEEREQAFEKYDAAMEQGHGAFLLDQDRPNIFTASVGNLLPGQEAVVLLSYATELEQSVDSIRLLIPTTISPRYIPPEVERIIDPAELDHIAPPTVLGGVPYGLKLNVELEAASDIREISCPSHPARVSLAGRKASVELMGENIQLDQDFVLTAKLAKSHEATALVARDSDGVRAVMVNLFPDLSTFKRGACEFVFVIDRSGSMDGGSIDQARNALLLALRSLEEGDRFNVIGFGMSIDAMFKESVAYSQATLDEATKKVQAMKADLGGTELLAPLQFVMEQNTHDKMPRQIVLLTDGEVGNEAQIIELATKHAASCRIFSFGIGHGASEHLVRGVARASGGRAEFIHPNERIEPIVLRQFARMASASLTNVRIDWGNLKTDLVAPAEAPQLFDGDRLTIYGRVIGGSSGEVAVVADSPQGALRFPARVDLEFVANESAIPVLMARKAIQELEEGRGAARGGRAGEAARGIAARADCVDEGLGRAG